MDSASCLMRGRKPGVALDCFSPLPNARSLYAVVQSRQLQSSQYLLAEAVGGFRHLLFLQLHFTWVLLSARVRIVAR